MSAAATVVSVQGEAFARSPNGGMRRLANGDTIQQGEVVITSAGGQVELLTTDGQMMSVNSQESFQFGPEASQATAPGAAEAAVTAATVIDPEQLLEQEAAAAGLGGGGENGGNSFVRLTRIAEGVTPLSYQFPGAAPGEILPFNSVGGQQGEDVPPATEPPATEPPATEPPATNQPPVADNDSSTGNTPGQPVTINVLDGDTDTDGTIDSSSVRIVGSEDGKTLVVEGQGTWTVNQDGTITFTPIEGFTGNPDPIAYNVADDDGARSNNASVTVAYTSAPTINGDDAGTVHEAALDTGSGQGEGITRVATGLVSVDDADIGDILDVTVDDAHKGLVTLAWDDQAQAVRWTYTLHSAVDNDESGENVEPGEDSFVITVTDAAGLTATMTVNIDIIDDMPFAAEAEDAALSTVQGSTDMGLLGINLGADRDGAVVSLVASGQVLDSQGNAITSGGNNLYYFSDGDGGLYAATEEGASHALEIKPMVAEDGTTSYTVTVTGVIDSNTSASPENISLTVTKFDHYDTQGTPVTYQVDWQNNGHFVPTLNTGLPDITFAISGFKDAKVVTVVDKNGKVTQETVFDGVIDTPTTAVNGSEQGMGVDNQFIDNVRQTGGSDDGAGEMLRIDFSRNITQATFTIDQLDAGQKAWYSIDNGTNWVDFYGTGEGAASDETLVIQGSAFDSILFKGDAGTSYRVIPVSVEETVTTQVPVYVDESYTVSILDVTGADQTIALQANATDGDGDSLESPVDFDVTLESPITYDAVTVNGQTVSGFSVEQGDKLDLSSILSSNDGTVDSLLDSGALAVNVSGSSATVTIDRDGGGTDYQSVSITLDQLDANTTAQDILNQIIVGKDTPA